MWGPLLPPGLWLGLFTLRWLDLAFGSSLSSRFSLHAPKIFVRGTIFTGGGGGGSDDDRWEGTGAIGPGGACAKAEPPSSNPTPPNTRIFSNCFMAFFPARHTDRGIPLDLFPQTPAKVPGLCPAFHPFVSKTILLPAGVEFAFPRSEGTVLRTFLPLFASLAALAAGPPPAAAMPSAHLNGVVYSEATNQRIPHASVWLCDDGGTRMMESVTTDTGEFAFLGLHAGAYILKITAPAFVPLELSVEVNFGTEHGISIFLKPMGKSPKEQSNDTSISAHELSIPAAARKFANSGKKKLYAGNDAAGAQRDFEAAVAKAPDYYEAYYQLGMACLSLQKPADAEKNLRTSVSLSNQTYPDAVLALAILLIGRHDSAAGEPLLRRGLELNPNSWAGYYELGKLELYRTHLEPALDAAQKAESLAPQQPKVYRLLSLIHLRQKNYQAALADLDAYIRLDPDSPEGKTAKQIRVDTQRQLETLHP
jgi:hypothetical protein